MAGMVLPMKLHPLASIGLGLCLLACSAAPVWAQPVAPPAAPAAAAPLTAPNGVILELFGNALVYSINYERGFTPRVGMRVGLMYVQANNDHLNENHFGGRLTLVPVMVHYLSGSGNNHFELGAGVLIGQGHWQFDTTTEEIPSKGGGGILGTFTIGYRRQSPAGRNIFRVGLTPIFDGSGGLPWAGISYGRRW